MAGFRTRIREQPCPRAGAGSQLDTRVRFPGQPARHSPVCASGKGEAQNSLDALGPLPGGLVSLLGGTGATPGWKRSDARAPESTSALGPDSQAFIAFGRRPNGRLYAASDGTISGGEHAPGARSTDDEDQAEAEDDPMFLAARARQEEERAEAAMAAAKRSASKAGPGAGEGEQGQQRRRGRGGRRTTTSKSDGAEESAVAAVGQRESQHAQGSGGRSRGAGGGAASSNGDGRGVYVTGADGSMWEMDVMDVSPSPSAALDRQPAVTTAAMAAEPSAADTRRRPRGSSGSSSGAPAAVNVGTGSASGLPQPQGENGSGSGSGSDAEGSTSGTESSSAAEGLIVSSAAAVLPQAAAAAAVAAAAASSSGHGSSNGPGGASGSSSRPGWATPGTSPRHGRLRTVTRPLPRVLFLHTGGTLGMDPEEAFEEDEGHNLRPRAGASDSYKGSLRPGEMLSSLLTMVPELDKFANVDLQVVFNKDSSRVGPQDWIHIAKVLHTNRPHYDAFVVVHGTDTLAYTASALSLMLCGFKKPIVMTGSQLPLRAPRTDARQNLLDSIQVATSASSPPHVELQEVAVCFGGKLMRGNRTQKVNSAAYQAFDSLTYPYL